MGSRIDSTPDDMDRLRAFVAQQQALLETQRRTIEAQRQALDGANETVAQQSKRLANRDAHIKALEHALHALNLRQFGASSEKHPDQFDFFNEAELLSQGDAAEDDDEPQGDGKPRKRRSRKLPEHLPRVERVHDLPESQRQCGCGATMHCIGEETHEQLGIVPQQYFVIVHRKLKYGCKCKGEMRRASLPPQPLPATAASAPLLAHTMVAKFHDGLPLYRQQRIAARDGLELSRARLARWHIGSAAVLQPLYNLLQETLWGYDIASSDATGIQVLKEKGRSPHTGSYLWIRRGGPPHMPVVLVDYTPTHSGAVAHGLLSEFDGYLLCDAAPVFNEPARRNDLVLVLCNDHARRRFREALSDLGKSKVAQRSIAAQAIKRYRALYRLEQRLKDVEPGERYAERAAQAVPLWSDFIAWATRVQAEGVAHEPTRKALAYLLNHATGLRRYCDDARLPISNIATEHVAKTIALARKNFLFADTPAGANSSATIYSVLESARANGHDAKRYMAVVLTELPLAATVDDIEALLPWNLTPEQVDRRYAEYPTLNTA